MADRRGDRARGRAHGARHRRLPQRHVRQRAGADHRPVRRQRGPDRGRARLADRVGDREPAARARLLARRRRPRRASTRWSSFLVVRARSGSAIALLPDPGDPRAGTATRTARSIVRLSLAGRRSRCSSSTSVVTWLHAAPPPQPARLRRAEAMAAWSLRVSRRRLGVATVVTAVVAEILVGSIEAFAEKAGLSRLLRRGRDRRDRRQRGRARRRRDRRRTAARSSSRPRSRSLRAPRWPCS